MDIKPLVGLTGIVLAVITADFTQGVTSLALPDVLGGLGIDTDQGTWITSLYATGQVIGMSLSPTMALNLTVRRWGLFAIALGCVSTICVPLTSNLSLIYGLSLLQGVSGGLVIPLLLIIGLRVLAPPIRLYGLALYAMSVTFGPNLSDTLAALWTGIVGWQFVFYEALPFSALAAVLFWYGVEQDEPRYERFRKFDWVGTLLVVVIAFTFVIVLEQGDRYDWFNSKVISVLTLVSVVAIPVFVLNEIFHPQPLFGFYLLKRRNIAYGLITLFTFLLLNLAASTLPNTFLREVQGYRPLQTYELTLLIALPQLIMLPLVAVVLNLAWVDSRVVSFIGMACILAACIGNVFLTSSVTGGGFLVWQGLNAIGQPMIIMPLLMMATNAIRKPEEGPLASALVNTCRAVAQPVGVWLLQLIMRWRGSLHTTRIMGDSAERRFSTLQAPALVPAVPPPLLPNGQPRFPGSLEAFSRTVQLQSTVMTLSDAFLVIAALTVALMVVVVTLPVRTYPPRIALAQK